MTSPRVGGHKAAPGGYNRLMGDQCGAKKSLIWHFFNPSCSCMARSISNWNTVFMLSNTPVVLTCFVINNVVSNHLKYTFRTTMSNTRNWIWTITYVRLNNTKTNFDYDFSKYLTRLSLPTFWASYHAPLPYSKIKTWSKIIVVLWVIH